MAERTAARIEGRSARRIAEVVREACVEAARAGYEEAAISGLCREGAFEAAVGAMRRLDLDALAQPGAEPPTPAVAAAATGALAAGLVEAGAARSAGQGPDAFRRRARAIAGRAPALRAALLAAAPGGAEPVAAADAALEVAARGAQLATLAAELTRDGPAASRRDATAALRLAVGAAECALALAEDDLRRVPDAEFARAARRRIWRARLLLQRARPALADGGPEAPPSG